PAYAVEYGSPNSAGRTVQAIQWAAGALVNPAGGGQVIGPVYTQYEGVSCTVAYCEALPYTVPSDKCAIIRHISWSSKFPTSGRSSYLGVREITLIDSQPNWEGVWIVMPGQVISVGFINNEMMTPEYGGSVTQFNNGSSWSGAAPGQGGEAMWMNMNMSGLLVDCAGG